MTSAIYWFKITGLTHDNEPYESSHHMATVFPEIIQITMWWLIWKYPLWNIQALDNTNPYQMELDLGVIKEALKDYTQEEIRMSLDYNDGFIPPIISSDTVLELLNV